MNPKSAQKYSSAVFQRQYLPRVAQRSSPWSFGLGIAGACGLGVITFLSLGSGQSAHSTPAAQPKPVRWRQAAPIPRMPPPPPSPMLDRRNTAPADSENPPLRWRAPAMIVDLSVPPESSPANGITSPPDDGKFSPEERFSARVSNSQVETARATHLRDLSYVAPQGTIVPAVLETAIDSDLPGFARAVISRDVHGFDGTRVLIPRGSKLIGQYRSGVAQGQSRAFVVWSRILTPDGISIDVGSPTTDELGRGGVEGETDSHFFERFGSAILLSVMSAGLTAWTNHASEGTVVVTSPDQANQVAGIALQKQIDIPVTVRVAQGTPLQVFVTRDLDFSGQSPDIKPRSAVVGSIPPAAASPAPQISQSKP